jgi:hypothetical protein
MRTLTCWLTLTFATALAAPAEPAPEAEAEPPTDLVEAHRRDVETWRQRRIEGLTNPEGWLSLVGLYWLQEGANTLGADPASAVVLPEGKAPARAGVVYLENGKARLEADTGAGIKHEGEAVTHLDLASDADENGPTVLELGDLVFYAIQRGEDLGIRIKDKESPARLAFDEIPIFPVDRAWRFETRFEAYDPPKTIPVPNIIGTVFDEPSWGAVVFDHAGRTHRLDVIAEPGAKRLFVIFADETTGRETYGAGRYVYTDGPDASGTVVLDFNMSYNPPCVFTAFATCPLPPKGNRLSFRVEAGEKSYEGPIPH